MGADSVGLLDDRFRIINVGTAEDHVRNGYEQRVIINSIQQALSRHGDAIIGLHHAHAGAVGVLGLPEVHDGRKVHVAVNDLVALAGKIEAGREDGLTGGHILVGGNGAFGRVHEGANFVSDIGP